MRIKATTVNFVFLFGLLTLVICGCKGTNIYCPGIATVKEIKVERRANSSSVNQDTNNNKNSNANISSPNKSFTNIPAPRPVTDSPEDYMEVVVDFAPDDPNVKFRNDRKIQGTVLKRKELSEKGIVVGGHYRVTAHYHGNGKMGYFTEIPVKDFQPVK